MRQQIKYLLQVLDSLDNLEDGDRLKNAEKLANSAAEIQKIANLILRVERQKVDSMREFLGFDE